MRILASGVAVLAGVLCGCSGLEQASRFRVADGFAMEPASNGVARRAPRPEATGTGFRKGTVFSINADGDLFATDSERTLHVIPGGNYDWETEPYQFDRLPAVHSGRRGAPAGAVFYEGAAYPEDYRGALFEADAERVTVLKLGRCGGTWCAAGPPKVFLRGEGIRDIGVGEDGNLWFEADRVYRVVYRPGLMQRMYAGSREEAPDRVGSLLALERSGPRPTADVLRPLSQDADPAMRGAAILVASFHGSGRAKAVVESGLSDTDAFVRRKALEGMVRMGLNAESYASFAPAEIVLAGLYDRDRFVRYAARETLEHYPREQWAKLALTERNPAAAPEVFYALARTAKGAAELDELFPLELGLLRTPRLTEDQRLNAVRALVLTAARREGGLPEGVCREASAVLAELTGDERLKREKTRALAFCAGK